MRARGLLVLIFLAAFGLRAQAEDLVIGLSAEVFEISSTFTGGTVTVFGTIERDAGTISRGGQYEVAIVVRGPFSEVVTRRKERVLGIWVNRKARVFPEAPSYYATLSSAPVDTLAGAPVLREYGIGAAYLPLAPEGRPAPDDAQFRDALVALKMEQGLFLESEEAVTFLSDHMFRATVPLPASVPTGAYVVEVYLFRDGVLLRRETEPFRVIKSGLERAISVLAFDAPLFYGLASVAIAFFIGWLGGVIFRRD